jgi:hypothetical protein
MASLKPVALSIGATEDIAIVCGPMAKLSLPRRQGLNATVVAPEYKNKAR